MTIEPTPIVTQLRSHGHKTAEDIGLLRSLWHDVTPASPIALTTSLRVLVPASVHERVGDLAQQVDATPNLLLVAAFRVLMYRYTGHERLPVIVSGKVSGDLGDTDTRLQKGITFRELLSRSVAGSMEARTLAYGNHEVRVPCVVALMEGSPADAAAPRAPAGVELALQLWRTPENLISVWWYSPTHLLRQAVNGIAKSFTVLLREMTRDPDRPLGSFTLISATEQGRLLAAGTGETLHVPRRSSVLRLFAEQRSRRPGAAALIQGGVALDYAEIDARSAGVAITLRALGVRPSEKVGLAVGTGPDLPIGLLGVWRAGATCVLLDPMDPAERLRVIARNAGFSIVYTGMEQANRIAELGVRTVTAASSLPGIGASPPLDVKPAPDDIAYLVYTSGTTGTPKGVPITHRQLLNFLYTIQHDYAFRDDDVLLSLARPAFGIIIFEALWPLTAGAATRFTPPGRGFDVECVCDDLERATAVHAVPATLRVILECLRARKRCGRDYDHLRRIFVGGDRVSRALLSDLARTLPKAQVYAQYGCTEATHLSLRYPVSPARLPDRGIVGKPFPNGHVRVCDEHANVLPVGVTGEILLGGAGITNGYLDLDELTQARFLRIDGVRYYRTGDLGRYLPDGSIEFVGRRDEQVKVRGMRVELGEIEAALAAHPALAAAAVLLGDGAAGAQLIACCVRAPGADLNEAALRSFLARRVPDYMMPSRFTFMDELPVNANRKVDRCALASAVTRSPVSAPATGVRLTPVQRALAEIWQQVLGVETIGPEDDFLDLGGDSLKATLVTNRLQDEFGEIVHVVALLDAPTLAKFASYLEQHYPEAVAKLVGEKPAPRDASIPSRVDAEKINALRNLIPPLTALEPSPAKNPRAIFVLSPPRSGSTLLRVMLGGHPQLFAPPELDLLSFATLAERKATLSGKYYFWLEGAVHAVMAIKGCTADEARAVLDDCEQRGLTTQVFYGLLQRWLHERILVDKTPYYGLNPAILARAEREFADPLYIHLVRHPGAMVHSFEEGRFDLVFFSKNRVAPSFPRRELGEMVWTLTHENILDFLTNVPPARQLRVRYEDLVRDPRESVERLCHFIGLPSHEAMLDPYGDAKARMTDGIHPQSKMLGDVKFHRHQRIDPGAADRWQQYSVANSLGDVTWDLAHALGYQRTLREERGT